MRVPTYLGRHQYLRVMIVCTYYFLLWWCLLWWASQRTARLHGLRCWFNLYELLVSLQHTLVKKVPIALVATLQTRPSTAS